MNQFHCITNGSGQTTGAEHATGEISVGRVAGPWTIELVGETGVNQRASLKPGGRLVIGSRRDSDLRVADSWVSGRHCVLDASGKALLLVDLSSKNGVYVGNVRVKSAELTGNLTRFTIGRTNIIVRNSGCDPAHEACESTDGLVGRSEPILRLKREIRRLAKLRAPVLIVGETGVGKDVVARALHTLSGRLGSYVPLNVATIPETLADSELFGHKKGAFTGALQARIGAFEQAHGGTLFLDEIGELALSVQAKMLRILEDGLVKPVGASEGHRVDVSVVSATWASLAERSAVGKFRFDLLQRLSMVIVEVPPLRERRSDVPILAEYWLRRHCGEFGARQLSTRAMERLCSYDWPGNVRELGGTIYRACALSDTEVIEAEVVARALSVQGMRYSRAGLNPRELLLQTGGNVSQAARLAGLPRTTFRTWLGRSKTCEVDEPQ